MSAILHNVAGPTARNGGFTRWLGAPSDPSRIVILNGHAEAWGVSSAGGAFSV